MNVPSQLAFRQPNLPFAFCSAALALLFALGCSTPASRIEDRQALFDGYEPSVQQAIRAGRVAPGMTEDAVWMALGDPDSKSVESSDAGEIVIWVWTRSSPGIGLSVGGGSYGGGGGVGGGVGIGSGGETDYEAVVHLRDGVVTYVRQATD